MAYVDLERYSMIDLATFITPTAFGILVSVIF
jgi:hypothetical protein